MEEKRLTPEAAKFVREYSGIVPTADFLYIPVMWRGSMIPDNCRPVFTLRGVDGVEALLDEDRLHGTVVFDEKTGERRVTMSAGEHRLRVCERGVRGWRNLHRVLPDGRLEPLPDVTVGAVTRESLRALTPDLISELCRAIEAHSVLSEEELRGFGL